MHKIRKKRREREVEKLESKGPLELDMVAEEISPQLTALCCGVGYLCMYDTMIRSVSDVGIRGASAGGYGWVWVMTQMMGVLVIIIFDHPTPSNRTAP